MVNAATGTLVRAPLGAGRHHHAAALRRPGYFGRAGGVAIHRYLDDAFVPAFLADAQALVAGTLAPGAHFAWHDADRFAGVAATCLRHPTTGTYYVVSVEAVCAIPGEPALDPKRVASAGFVVRRVLRDGTHARWMIVRGEAAGWQPAGGGELDPDHARRGARGEPPAPEPPYTGEQTHPLHPLLVRGSDGRSHTVLHGYLPVAGGSARVVPRPGPGGTVPADQEAGLRDAMGRMRPWPFGMKGSHAWSPSDGAAVAGGIATRDFFNLLHDLVHRHGVGIHGGGDNQGLETALANWKLQRTDYAGRDSDGRDILRVTDVALLDWLRSRLEPLTRADPDTSALHDLLGRRDLLLGPAPLTPLTGLEAGGNVRDWRLTIDATQAATLRDALLARDLVLIDRTVGTAPMPRVTHADDERFVVVPFVRWAGEHCTHVAWGEPSAAFRIASPFDPEAARPTVIQMPSLKDMRRGVLGAHFVAPKDLAEKLLGMQGEFPDVKKGSLQLPNMCWSFSFSLPGITICAFLLLYIVINILNIIFFWLPWIFLKLPSFCFRRSP